MEMPDCILHIVLGQVSCWGCYVCGQYINSDWERHLTTPEHVLKELAKEE